MTLTLPNVSVVDAVDGSKNPAVTKDVWVGWRMTEGAVQQLVFDSEEAKLTAVDMWTKDLNAGEAACTLSHLRAWTMGAKGKEDYIVIFEDDANIEEFDMQGLMAVLTDLKSHHFDVLRLQFSASDPRGSVQLRDESEWAESLQIHLPCGQKLVKGSASWTGAYLLTKAACVKLSNSGLEKCIVNVDDFLYALSLKHPRTDLSGLGATKFVLENGAWHSIRHDMSCEKENHWGEITLTAASRKGDCFGDDALSSLSLALCVFVCCCVCVCVHGSTLAGRTTARTTMNSPYPWTALSRTGGS